MKGSLSRFPAPGTGRKRIKPILQDIEIEGAHLDRAKILNAMVDRVELETLITLANPGDEFLKLMECPSVHFMKLITGNAFFLRMEVVKIPEKKSKGVSDPKVAVGQTFQDLVGDLNVISVILRRDPEPQDIGA
jgi:hypothetical protein